LETGGGGKEMEKILVKKRIRREKNTLEKRKEMEKQLIIHE